MTVSDMPIPALCVLSETGVYWCEKDVSYESQNHRGLIQMYENGTETESLNYGSLITKADVGHQFKNQHFILEHVNSSLILSSTYCIITQNEKDMYCCKIHCVSQ